MEKVAFTGRTRACKSKAQPLRLIGAVVPFSFAAVVLMRMEKDSPDAASMSSSIKRAQSTFRQPIRIGIIVATLGCLLLLPCVGSTADAGASAPPPSNLGDLTIEDLMNVTVTSVAKKETPLQHSPAAIAVITSEDIRRIGATTIPEALRIVPGMNVARINANEWAVSSRGFNSQYANKLLVLVDGRSAYTPTFAGVYWHSLDLMLEDLDRIEVIRGPGGALWGANAVNGVINIISKSARDTQGFLANTAFGTDLQPLSSVRYGGQIGTNLYFRLYGQLLNHSSFEMTDGSDAHDDWTSGRGGLRLDWHPTEHDHLLVDASLHLSRIAQEYSEAHLTPVAGMDNHIVNNDNRGGHVLGRWNRNLAEDSGISLQFYWDRFDHTFSGARETRDTFDIEGQHHFQLGSRQSVMWGLGYRYSPAHNDSSETSRWLIEDTHDQLVSAFLQDEINLIPDQLKLTLGAKLEHNDYTGFEFQPSGRLLWTPHQNHSLWGSISRAVRTPSRFEKSLIADQAAFQPPASPPVLITVFPAEDLKAEELLAFELGYRVEATKQLAFDVAGFYNQYDHLITYSPGAPEFTTDPAPPHLLIPLQGNFNNSGETYGVEIGAQWQPFESWKIAAGYTWLHMRLHPEESPENENPQHQVQLRSSLSLTRDLTLHGAAYYVDDVTVGLVNGSADIPSYIRVDAGLTWRPKPWVEFSIWGQNLFDDGHPESPSYHT